jgi:hypothetical protein
MCFAIGSTEISEHVVEVISSFLLLVGLALLFLRRHSLKDRCHENRLCKVCNFGAKADLKLEQIQQGAGSRK